MKTVAFFIRHFTERGTEVSAYQYAYYNETLLHNKSYIICFTPEKQASMGWPMVRHSYQKFKDRFPVLEINDIKDIGALVDQHKLDFFYTQTHGGKDVYEFQDKSIWSRCKTIKHCVFTTYTPEADLYISISGFLNKRFTTSLPVLPYIATMPPCSESLRKDLDIPNDALVLGRHGGADQFDIPYVHSAIRTAVEQQNIYFVFLNTNIFHKHPRIRYLDCSIDPVYKAKFIHTCDAMIHARKDGETFGLAVAEFSVMNKPVITCKTGDLEHIDILGDRAILYDSEKSLLDVFKNLPTILSSRSDWNAYENYSPEKIMSRFKTLLESV
jgi:hypothetical protein